MKDGQNKTSWWREALYHFGVWLQDNSNLAGAIIVATPIVILQIIAYDNGYSGWIDMVLSWLNFD